MTENYFNHLNYSLANEDTRLELALCKQYRAQSILSICGSGGRFLPLLAAGAKAITAIDLAAEQLYLAELRKASILHCDFDDFIKFWGFAPFHPNEHRALRKELFFKLQLSNACRQYFQLVFVRNRFKGLIYTGKWERTIVGIPRAIRPFVGKSYDKIFSFQSQEEQDEYIKSKLSSGVWKFVPKAVLTLFGNSAFFNAMLYHGSFVKKNIPGSYYEFYRQAFLRLFFNGLARENYFLQLCFFGKVVYPEGNPVEALPEVFLAARQCLHEGAEIRLERTAILDFVRTTSAKFDFVSLSDVPSYLTGEDEKNYLQTIKRCLLPGAIVVVRCYLRIPEQTDLSGYQDISLEHKDLIASEKVQMYSIFIYRYLT
jgi:S-adenosylmethionine-diacylglycerol 3-amino-3-carboxypropyl transferase